MNIFDIPRPQESICWVSNYIDDMSSLTIGVFQADQPLLNIVYIHFLHVHYFDGPMKWAGANFQIGSISERNDLMFSYSDWPPDISIIPNPMISIRDRATQIETFAHSTLYKATSLQGYVIKIIGNQAYKTTTMPKF